MIPKKRELVVVLVLAAIAFLGFRYQQRVNLQVASTKIQAQGGSVLYGFQTPRVVNLPVHVENAYWTVRVPFTVANPDGKTTTRMREEMARNTGHTVWTDEMRANDSSPPGFQLSTFLLGSHDDVAIAAVTIPAASVNQDLINTMSAVPHLKHVVLQVERRYFSVKSSRRRTEAERAEELEQLGQDLKAATELMERQLPNVKLLRRGIMPIAERKPAGPLSR